MGNPAIFPEDGGPCIECKHCQGFHTGSIWGVLTMCSKVPYFRLYLEGCRRWEPSDAETVAENVAETRYRFRS